MFDYKKEYKEFYLPPDSPGIIRIPAMNFAAVRGRGDPNEEGSEYGNAVGLLYGTAYTLKMGAKGSRRIDGCFDYVMPPLEGFWWMDGIRGMDYKRKDQLRWISVLRLPEFVKKEDFDWAVSAAAAKKKQDFSKVEFLSCEEGLCVQCLHIGPYDGEPATVERMDGYAAENGYEIDISNERHHHEIYLGSAEKGEIVVKEKMQTVYGHLIHIPTESGKGAKKRGAGMRRS